MSTSGQRAGLIRLDLQQAGDVVVDDLVFASGGDGPDHLVTIAGHHIEDLHLALHHVGVGLAEPGQSRAASEDVVAIDDAVAAEPVVALLEHRLLQPFDLGTFTQRAAGPPEQLSHDHSGQQPVAVFEQVDAVEREVAGVLGVELS